MSLDIFITFWIALFCAWIFANAFTGRHILTGREQ